MDSLFDLPRPGARVARSGLYQMVGRNGVPLGAPFRHQAGTPMPPAPERHCRWQYVGPLGLTPPAF